MTCVDAAKAKDREWAKRQKSPERELMVLDWREGMRIITKQDAERVKLAWYCENEMLDCGHIAPRWVDTDQCRVCSEQHLNQQLDLVAKLLS